ncbi:hypothetical protein WA158_002235 [Blastocystis sp. Blastoise]
MINGSSMSFYKNNDFSGDYDTMNIVDMLRIDRIEEILIPYNINLFVIGLDDFEFITPELLTQWLSSLETVIPSPFLINRNQSYSFSKDNITPLTSPLQYVLQYHIYRVSPFIPKYLQQLIEKRARKINIYHESIYILHPYEMEIAFDSLLSYVSKNNIVIPKGYTIFLLNICPNLPKKYGYSDLLTVTELMKMSRMIMNSDSLYNKEEYIDMIRNGKTIEEDIIDKEPLKKKKKKKDKLFNSKHVKHQRQYHMYQIKKKTIDIIDIRSISHEWVLAIAPQLIKDNTKYDVVSRQFYLLENYYSQEEKESLLLLLRKILNTPFDKYSTLQKLIENNHIISDIWQSKQSYSWIDMSSGPFTWGNLYEPTYLHTFQTLPQSPKVIQELLSKSEIQIFIQYCESLLNSLMNNCIPDTQLKCIQAQQVIQDLLNNIFTTLSNSGTINTSTSSISQASRNLKQGISNIYSNILKTSSSSVLASSLSSVTINLFLEQYNNLLIYEKYCLYLSSSKLELPHEYKYFMNHLFESLNNYIVNIIIPHFYLPQHTPSTIYKDYYSYYIPKQIHFHIYLINDCNTKSESHDQSNRFNIELFKRLLLKSKLQTQQYIMDIQQLYLYDSSSLSVAFTSSLKSNVFFSLQTNNVETKQQQYIDSNILYEYIQKLENEHNIIHHDLYQSKNSDTNQNIKSKINKNNHSFIRDINIYLFDLEEEKTLLFDKWYESVHYGDTIFAINNHDSSIETEFLFDSNHIYYGIDTLMSSLLSTVYNTITYTTPPSFRYNKFTHQVFYDWYFLYFYFY